MSEDLVKFRLPASFVASRVALRPSELAYGYVHGWVDEVAVVRIAERAMSAGRDISPPVEELAVLLSDDFGRVADLIAEIDDTAEGDPGRVWLYLALGWLWEHRDESADPLGVIEMLYADFDYPSEIEGLVRFMPPLPGAAMGLDAIDERWREYLRLRPEEYSARS